MYKWIFIVILGALILLGVGVVVLNQTASVPADGTGATTTPPAAKKAGIPDVIEIDAPTIDAVVSSPVTISGSARGQWYFEASFPVEVRNASGSAIAVVPAQAQGEWMTTDFVPFTVAITYPPQPAGSKGSIVLHKDNPSGLPENDRSVVIPVTFR